MVFSGAPALLPRNVGEDVQTDKSRGAEGRDHGPPVECRLALVCHREVHYLTALTREPQGRFHARACDAKSLRTSTAGRSATPGDRRRASRPQTVSGAAVLYTSSAQENFRPARSYLRSSAANLGFWFWRWTERKVAADERR